MATRKRKPLPAGLERLKDRRVEAWGPTALDAADNHEAAVKAYAREARMSVEEVREALGPDPEEWSQAMVGSIRARRMRRLA